MKTLYLVPARGGSKGVPGKNIRLLGGIPLIGHSIRQALKVADRPEDVVVTTDSREIADIAAGEGARIPFLRPAELASDTAGSREVILHAIDSLNARGEGYEAVVLLQPTSPLRNIEDIRNAVTLFRKRHPGMVVSAAPARSNPYYNAFECDADGFLKISKGDGLITRRQDAPQVWEFDGSIYVIDPEALRKAPSIARIENILPLPLKEKGVDIDSELDFIIAEHLLNS